MPKDKTKALSKQARQTESKRERYNSDPAYRERRKEIARAWYHRAGLHPKRVKNDHRYMLLVRARSRARVFEREFNITVEDIPIPVRCPVLGIPLVVRLGEGKGPKYDSPSVDRIDSNLGYVKGNVRVISWRANTLKSNADYSEILALYADAIRLRATR